MLQIKLTDKAPSIAETASVLTRHTQQFGVPMDFDRMVEYFSYYTLKGEKIKRRIAAYIMPNEATRKPLTEELFRQFLISNRSTEGLLLTKGGKLSLSGDSIQAAIDTGLHRPEIVSLMKLYDEAAGYLHKVSMLPEIIDNCRISPIETWDNHRLAMVKPIWVPQNTGRLGARNPGIMNFDKEILDIFTIPKGWIWFEADSGQIEPRLLQSYLIGDPLLKKCTMTYNDAYYGYLHYCTVLTDAERRDPNTVIKPLKITDELVEKRSKFKTFGNAVMYGSTENRVNDPDKAAFIEILGKHPNRLRIVRDIEKRILNGERVFKTVFGTEINITSGPSEDNYKDKTSDAYFSHLNKCALNNPIQGTAADLMRMSVAYADRLLMRKAPCSAIMMYVHDSGKFAIHENEYNNVIDELKEITAYQVEDWVPIYCDPKEGVHKGELKRFIA